MRKYINQIDNDLIKLKFSPEELHEYKKLTRNLCNLQDVIHEFEKDACNRLSGSMIGTLQKVKFNYLSFGDTFYMSYEDNKPIKKWYEFWK